MQKIMNFPSAIREIINGKKLTKIEWGNKDICIFLKDSQLKIKLGDGSIVSLIVSEGDMVGTDWVVIGEVENKFKESPATTSPTESPTSLVVIQPPQVEEQHIVDVTQIGGSDEQI